MTEKGVSGFTCPVCEKPLRITRFGYGCTGYPECRFLIREVAHKKLTDKQISDLLTKGQTGLTKGFKKKDGGKFDAMLRLENGKIAFAFPPRNHYFSFSEFFFIVIITLKKRFGEKENLTMKKFVNLTAHPVNLLPDSGEKITFPASGTIARVGIDQVKFGDVDGIPVFRTVFSKDITDLPAPADDTIFIVSTLVAQAAVNRDDLVVPANLIRDDNGMIIGASGFQIF